MTPHPRTDRCLSIDPPLDPATRHVLEGFAGLDATLARFWPGRPGPPSPWRPCTEGCCLVLHERRGSDVVGWLRFLLREVLAPQAQAARRRVTASGLGGPHLVAGRVRARDQRVVVSANRVRSSPATAGGEAQPTER